MKADGKKLTTAFHAGAGPRASLAMRAVGLLLRLQGKGELSDLAAAAEKYRRRAYPKPAPVTRPLRAGCDVREGLVQGRPVFTLTPKAAPPPAHIIYTHGGGYRNPLTTPHWWIIRQLVERTKASVTVPIYPLAPEHTYGAAYSLLEEVYRGLTAETPAGRVVLCGDSSGGGWPSARRSATATSGSHSRAA